MLCPVSCVLRSCVGPASIGVELGRSSRWQVDGWRQVVATQRRPGHRPGQVGQGGWATVCVEGEVAIVGEGEEATVGEGEDGEEATAGGGVEGEVATACEGVEGE